MIGAKSGSNRRRGSSRRLAIAAVLAVAAMLVCFLTGCQSQAPSASEDDRMDVVEPEAPAASGVKHVVLIGDDAWAGAERGRSDLLMLLRVDLDNHVITEVSIPRDTAYEWTDGSTIKINSAYEWEGPEAACEAVSEVCGVEVDDYVAVDFDGFQSIVGFFGGIDVDLPVDLTYHFYTNDHPDEHYAAGEQTLDPWRAMALSRARTGYEPYGLEQDMMRQVIDRQMLTTLIGYVFAGSDDPAGALEQLLPFVSTNIDADELLGWADALAQADEIAVYGTSGPTSGGIDPETQLWLVPPQPEKWAALMEVVEAGGDPSTVDVQSDSLLQLDDAPVNSATVIAL